MFPLFVTVVYGSHLPPLPVLIIQPPAPHTPTSPSPLNIYHPHNLLPQLAFSLAGNEKHISVDEGGSSGSSAKQKHQIFRVT